MEHEPDFPPRKVLVIAYYFPPMGLSGVQRTLKFVKYFSDFGWHPTVLTVEPHGYIARDQSLLDDLAGRPVDIVRTPIAGPARFWKKKEVVNLPPERIRRVSLPLDKKTLRPQIKAGAMAVTVPRVQMHQIVVFEY